MRDLLLMALAVTSSLAWPGAKWVAVTAVLLAAWAGTTLPDIDQWLPLGGHRSALTHSALPLLLGLWRREVWPVAAGLGFGLGFHLAADFFPNGMTGYALVKIPVYGAVSAWGSWLWLGINSFLCFWIASLLMRWSLPTRFVLPAMIGVAAIGVAYLFMTDGGWPALLLLMGSASVALRLEPRPSIIP